MPKEEALQILINNVEGNYSELSWELGLLAEKQISSDTWMEMARERDGYAKGGMIAYADWDYDNRLGTFSSMQKMKEFAMKNKGKYNEIIFEDEYGDNIVVTKNDTQKDLDYLFSEMSKGGSTYAEGGDLFEHYERLPDNVQKLYFSWGDRLVDGAEYEDLKQMLSEFEELGYTFDYGLDAEPYDLRAIDNV